MATSNNNKSVSSKFLELLNDTKHLEKLSGQIEKEDANKKGGFKDDRYWKPELDKAGNGYAVIRFLPLSEPDMGKLSVPFVRLWHHGFQGPTGLWYIENSRTTLNEKDPCGELNSKLWASGSDAQKEVARKQKRKLSFISNVLILQDEKNPSNVGKVFLFKYGVKLYDKIKRALEPEFSDEVKFNPFHMIDGANFKLKIRKGEGGFPNYDSSAFDSPSPLYKGDPEKLQAVWEKQHSLMEEIAPSKFKSYDELNARLLSVTGQSGGGSSSSDDHDENVDEWALPTVSAKPVPARAAPAPKPAAEKDVSPPWVEEEEDPDLEMFRNLAKG